MPEPAKVLPLEEFDAIPGPGSLTWLPVRHTLGVRAFGCNAYVAADAGDDVVEPHREADESDEYGHEELYFVARGHARFTIDQADHDAPAGTYVFIPDPSSHRHAVALEAGTTVLSFGGPPTFQPSGWEAAFRAAPLMADPSTRPQAREILDEALARIPGDGGLLYNLACLDALAGDADAALDHLRGAIEAHPQFRASARDDDDLGSLREDPRFIEVVGEG